MGTLQNAFDEALATLPRQILLRLVKDKLEKHGVSDDALAEHITTAISDGASREDLGEDEIEIDVELPFDFGFDDDELAGLEKSFDTIVAQIPDMVETVGKGLARDIADDCHVKWQTQAVHRAAEREGLRRKIASEWGDAFSSLRLLIELCAGHGDDFNRAHLNSRLKRNHLRNMALSRLHIRACRVADEIVTLLESGFAEGAEARWRTLLEVSVIALLIAEGGDTLAERYFDHEAIERERTLADDDRSVAAGGGRHISAAERKAIMHDHARVVRKYPDRFKGAYGWAGGQLGLQPNPQFPHLLEKAGALSVKGNYRLASFGIHASPRTLRQPMHQWNPTLHVPGAFAAGFENAGGSTARTLVLITSALFDQPWDIDKMVELLVLACIRDDTEGKLDATARRIARVEQREIDRAARRSTRRIGWRNGAR